MNQDILASYETSDIILASVFKTQGFKLDEITLNGNKGIFKFLNIDRQILLDFDMGKILVEPVAFNNSIKSLTTAVRRLSKG